LDVISGLSGGLQWLSKKTFRYSNLFFYNHLYHPEYYYGKRYKTAPKTLKVTSVSDEHLNLAKQPSQAIDNLANEPSSTDPVYTDEELVRRAKNDDPWAIEQLVLKYQKKVYTIAFQG